MRRPAPERGGVTDVFVSYKAEDRARVAPLVAALTAEGLSVWWDAHIVAGEEWRERIQQELDATKCVVVVWSNRSVAPEGRFVRDEATRAERRGVYLPVRIDPVEPPLGFGETQALNLAGWKGDRGDPRFTATVAAVRAVLAQKPRPRAAPAARSVAIDRRLLLAGGGGVLLAGVGGWWWLRDVAAPRNSLAVLPFANLSGDPARSYFGDGIAEELRIALARIPGLQVMARISSEAVRGLDVAAAAAKLGVGDILSGSVRHSPSTIRISAELVNGRTGVEAWSDSYDRPAGDSLSIQSEIAGRVAAALGDSFFATAKAVLRDPGTRNATAQDMVLRALQVSSQQEGEEGIRQTLGLAEAALSLDPRYAAAKAIQAAALANLGVFYPADDADQQRLLKRAEEAARGAIALDPTRPGGFQALGFVRKSRLDLRGALESYRRGHARGADARASVGYAYFLAEMGRAGEAMEPAAKAIAVDPLNPDAFGAMGNVQYLAGRYEAAIVALRTMLRMAPDRYYARYFIALSLMWLGRSAAALAELRPMPADDLFRNAAEAIIQARAGDPAASDRALAVVAETEADVLQAAVHSQRGERDQAFALLNKALAERSPDITAIRADPAFRPIRSDPRFKALLAKLDFP